MPRKSSVQELDPRLREVLDALIREGRHTLDEILAKLAELNDGNKPVSRSALGRYAQQAEQQMQRYREAQEVSKVWLAKLEAEPDGDVARLLPEMLRMVCFKTIGEMDDREEPAEAMEVMLLAKALDHLGKASGAHLAVELKMREVRKAAKAAAAEAKAEMKRGGVSDETADTVFKLFAGIA